MKKIYPWWAIAVILILWETIEYFFLDRYLPISSVKFFVLRAIIAFAIGSLLGIFGKFIKKKVTSNKKQEA
jgi:hypothetical protein